ncbi:MAG TPA: RNA polymerase sigma-70 factor [Sunxiuqinia sp.]|nr:RNA polymerase sigma-70 factor [Sunxiuqinia sp.]
MEREEKLLFSKIKEGDEEAFNKAFDLYYNRLCFFTNNLIHDFDLSRSHVQQVFVDLWIKRDQLSIEFSLKSFLFQSARNKALDHLKHRKVEANFVSSTKQYAEEPSFNDQLEEAELNDKISTAIQNLPPKCREIFKLCRFEELKYAEIAERLNISVKTVEMQMSIALKKLRKQLSEAEAINLTVFILSKKN